MKRSASLLASPLLALARPARVRRPRSVRGGLRPATVPLLAVRAQLGSHWPNRQSRCAVPNSQLAEPSSGSSHPVAGFLSGAVRRSAWAAGRVLVLNRAVPCRETQALPSPWCLAAHAVHAQLSIAFPPICRRSSPPTAVCRLRVTGALQTHSASAATCSVVCARQHAQRQTQRVPWARRSQATCAGTYRSSSSGFPRRDRQPVRGSP